MIADHRGRVVIASLVSVKPTVGPKLKSMFNTCLFDSLNDVNKTFADVATDTQTSQVEINELTDSVSGQDCKGIRLFNEYEIF
jgi:hypothetical protein